jgi:ParB-like nuclease family protein
MKKATISRTPDDIAEALKEAERQLKQPPDGKQQVVQIRPSLIATGPELFQPRGFASRNALDTGHVKKLVRRIATKGELKPPLVVQLGTEWVCVDGHHRIAAYLRHHGEQWSGTIRCQWFSGTIREAVDESVRRNDEVKLEMRLGDKYEAAWQRVVLGWGSKKQIREVRQLTDVLASDLLSDLGDLRVKQEHAAGQIAAIEEELKLRGHSVTAADVSPSDAAWARLIEEAAADSADG